MSTIQDAFENIATEDSVCCTAFLKSLYALQTNYFLLWNANRCFHFANGTGTGSIGFKEYKRAMEEVVHVKYTNNPKTMNRLLTDVRTKNVDGEYFKGIRGKMVEHNALLILVKFSATIKKTFSMYATDEDGLEKMSLEGCIDYFSGYFVCPEYLTENEIMETVREVKESFVVYGQGPIKMDELFLPQFIEVLCIAATKVHARRVDKQGGCIRSAIERAKLDFCLERLFKHMGVVAESCNLKYVNLTSETTIELSEMNEFGGTILNSNRSIESLERSMESLFLQKQMEHEEHVPVVKPGRAQTAGTVRKRVVPDSTMQKARLVHADYDVVIVHEIQGIPSFSKDIVYKLEQALTYHNNKEYEMSLSSFADAKNAAQTEYGEELPQEANIFFSIAQGNVYESERKDTEAFEHYMRAREYLAGLAQYHPAHALVYSCLGSVCYYNGKSRTALQCYSTALEIRLKDDSESVDVASALNNIGCCYYVQGLTEEAYARFKKAFDILESNLGVSNPRCAMVLQNLEKSKSRAGRLSDRGMDLLRNSRLDTHHIIPGGRFYIKAKVTSTKLPKTTSKKKKKVAKKK